MSGGAMISCTTSGSQASARLQKERGCCDFCTDVNCSKSETLSLGLFVPLFVALPGFSLSGHCVALLLSWRSSCFRVFLSRGLVPVCFSVMSGAVLRSDSRGRRPKNRLFSFVGTPPQRRNPILASPRCLFLAETVRWASREFPLVLTRTQADYTGVKVEGQGSVRPARTRHTSWRNSSISKCR